LQPCGKRGISDGSTTRSSSAWDLEGALGDWIGGTEFADGEGAEGDVVFDIEFGHGDVDMRDIKISKR
jgi:hypothetical protein